MRALAIAIAMAIALLSGCFSPDEVAPARVKPAPIADEDPGENVTAPPPPETLANDSQAAVTLSHPWTTGATWVCVACKVPTFTPNMTGVVKATLTATWNASTVGGSTLTVELSAKTGSIAKASGASPLVIDADVPRLTEAGTARVFAFLEPAGVLVDQKVQYVLVLERSASAGASAGEG